MIRTIARACRQGAIAACLLAVLLPGAASAGEVADRAAAAEALLSDGKVQEAVDAFDAAADAFWAELPLTLSTAIFAEAVQSYGSYTPKAEAKFRSGETVLIYLEPIGFGWVTDGNGFKADLEADVEIRSPAGLVFAKAESFAAFTPTRGTRSHELDLRLRLTLPTLKPGDYELLLTLRDAVTGKSAGKNLPFTVVE